MSGMSARICAPSTACSSMSMILGSMVETGRRKYCADADADKTTVASATVAARTFDSLALKRMSEACPRYQK